MQETLIVHNIWPDSTARRATRSLARVNRAAQPKVCVTSRHLAQCWLALLKHWVHRFTLAHLMLVLMMVSINI